MVPTSRAKSLLLAGPSSAGKTSLAQAFQRVASEPWFFFEADRMSGGFPRGRSEFVTTEWDRRVREACARAARGVVEAGLNVVVELGLFDPWGRAKIAAVLSAFPTFVIRVRCDLATLERREAARGDRFVGTARRQHGQLEGVPFDFEVLTDELSPELLAQDLARWLATNPVPRAVYDLSSDPGQRDTVEVRDLELGDGPACDAVITTLPYFFGLPDGVAECAMAVRSQPGLVALDNAGAVVAFLTYRSHHAASAEITWMAVRQDRRRRGVGRTLIDAMVRRVSPQGVRLVFVITLGPSVAEPGVTGGYGGTRAFYEAVGFVPLKELDVWGPDSAGVILARPTGPSDGCG